jgi:hypothetical protein
MTNSARLALDSATTLDSVSFVHLEATHEAMAQSACHRCVDSDDVEVERSSSLADAATATREDASRRRAQATNVERPLHSRRHKCSRLRKYQAGTKPLGLGGCIGRVGARQQSQARVPVGTPGRITTTWAHRLKRSNDKQRLLLIIYLLQKSIIIKN